jgi:Zn-dependent peptidase ImmA (M78 family)/transcriptional regulator with XRE-family HTH domain
MRWKCGCGFQSGLFLSGRRKRGKEIDMAEALVSPEVLKWARQRAAMPVDAVAGKLKTGVEKVLAWEEGAARPTFKQAEKIAAFLHIPFGFLFLPEPPEEKLPIPDLRTRDGMPRQGLGADFLDLLRDVMFKRGWYQDYLENHGAGLLPFVGKFAADAPVDTVAADIREALRINPGELSKSAGTWEQHLNDLFDRCEDIGIWVMRTGYVGSNTRRTLDVSDFRGFAIADRLALLIFINGRDAKAAQAFTLAHELAHIWLGQSGVSDPYLNRVSDHEAGIERKCNAIAAEVLVPRSRFMDAWDDGRNLAWNAQTLSHRFKVSRVVIARRALDCGKITWDEHQAFFEQERLGWQKQDDSGSGIFYATVPVKNGRRFTRAMLNSAMSGDLMLRDAGSLLHMKPATVQKLHARNSMGS